MASTIGVVLILLGGFLMAVGYGMVSDCLSTYRYSPCWNPLSRGGSAGALGFYLGAVIAGLGTILLVGPNVARSLGKLKGAGRDSE